MSSDKTRRTIGLTQEITSHVYLPAINCSASRRAALDNIIPFNYEDDAFQGLLTMADRIYATVDESVRLGDRFRVGLAEMQRLYACLDNEVFEGLRIQLWSSRLIGGEVNNALWLQPWNVEVPQ